MNKANICARLAGIQFYYTQTNQRSIDGSFFTYRNLNRVTEVTDKYIKYECVEGNIDPVLNIHHNAGGGISVTSWDQLISDGIIQLIN